MFTGIQLDKNERHEMGVNDRGVRKEELQIEEMKNLKSDGHHC